jgi:predicted transcriptional regulator
VSEKDLKDLEELLDEDGVLREGKRPSLRDISEMEVLPPERSLVVTKVKGRTGQRIDTAALSKMASVGCTQRECCSILGISIAQFRSDPELLKVWQNGRDHGRMSLRRALFDNAVNQNNVAAQIHLAKQKSWLNHTERKEITGEGGGPISFAALAQEAAEAIDVDYEEQEKLESQVNLSDMDDLDDLDDEEDEE